MWVELKYYGEWIHETKFYEQWAEWMCLTTQLWPHMIIHHKEPQEQQIVSSSRMLTDNSQIVASIILYG